MSKTSNIKDRMLAVAGYIRSKHVSKLLLCHPRTVHRYNLESMNYGSVTYIKWDGVLKYMDKYPLGKKMLNLPLSATGALDKAVLGIEPTPLTKAEEAVAKAKKLLSNTTELPSSLPVVAAVYQPDAVDDSPVLTVLTKVVEEAPLLTVDGPVAMVAPVVKHITLGKPCTTCSHWTTTYHDDFGFCNFAKGTIAACTCKNGSMFA